MPPGIKPTLKEICIEPTAYFFPNYKILSNHKNHNNLRSICAAQAAQRSKSIYPAHYIPNNYLCHHFYFLPNRPTSY
jgi:hypothetical protein